MAKLTQCYEDSRGRLHRDPEEATRADIAHIISGGTSNNDDTIAPGLAKTIFERRADIERAFREYDHMTSQCAATQKE